MVEPLVVSGRLTFSADASEEKTSRMLKRVRLWRFRIASGPKSARTAAPMIRTAATYRRAAMGSSFIGCPRRTRPARAPSRTPQWSARSGFLVAAPAARACPRLGREAEFDDLPVKRAAADGEHPGGFLLVPAHGFQYPDNVGPLGLGERGKPVAGRGAGGQRRVKEFDVGSPDAPARRGQRRARHRAFEL